MRLLRDLVAAAVILAVVVLAVREYRSDGSGAQAGSDDVGGSSLPACADVWVDGETLPADYEGCINDTNQMEVPASIDCDSGIGIFVTYQDRFLALAGQQITEAPSESDAYGKAYEECVSDG